MEIIFSVHTHAAAVLALTLWWFCRSGRTNGHVVGVEMLAGGLALTFLSLSALDLLYAPLGLLDLSTYSAWRKGARLMIAYVLVLTWVDILYYRRRP